MISSRLLTWLTILGLLSGTVYRLFPIFTGQPALSEFFLTEDGYLMLTIARNMAIGLGMTVSDGTIATNGVQPLAAFLFTLPYLATGGAKVASLVGIHLIMATIALGGVFAVKTFAVRVLGAQGKDMFRPWVTALLWFLSPLMLLHTMNGLETGLYCLTVIVTLLMFLRLLDLDRPLRATDHLLFGAICGLTFLARNDAVFLLCAIYLVWAVEGLVLRRDGLLRVAARLLPSGLLSLIFAAPWLINNQVKFGSIVPISGQAESLTARFGENLHLLPIKVFEYLFPMLPIPNRLETLMPVLVITTLVSLFVCVWFLIGVWRQGNRGLRLMIGAYALYAAILCAYYGLYFGAGHFMSRYTAPLAPLLMVATVWVATDLVRRLFATREVLAIRVAGLAGLALCIGLLGRLLVPGVQDQGHMQVVDWVRQNVPETAWVGAVQTGTLGYWHDRTINLDGKVNPQALEARKTEGNVLAYVTASQIDYIADWVGVAGWASHKDSSFATAFELVKKQRNPSLAVLKRRDLRDHG